MVSVLDHLSESVGIKREETKENTVKDKSTSTNNMHRNIATDVIISFTRINLPKRRRRKKKP